MPDPLLVLPAPRRGLGAVWRGAAKCGGRALVPVTPERADLVRRSALVGLAALVLAGCGRKGPLYRSEDVGTESPESDAEGEKNKK